MFLRHRVSRNTREFNHYA